MAEQAEPVEEKPKKSMFADLDCNADPQACFERIKLCEQDPTQCSSKVEVAQEGMGVTDESSETVPTAGKKSKKHGGDVDFLEPENDPVWYRQHSAEYPCFKFTEEAIFNLDVLKNVQHDWKISDSKSGSQIYFNVCQFTDQGECRGEEGAQIDENFAYRIGGSGKCEVLTSDTPKSEVTESVVL